MNNGWQGLIKEQRIGNTDRTPAADAEGYHMRLVGETVKVLIVQLFATQRLSQIDIRIAHTK